VRFYTGSDPSSDDPADFKLEGSNNGGTSYTTIVPTTALSLPNARNNGAAVDPLVTPVQEILFANSQAYTSYRLTFNNTKDNNSANIMSIGELELLGIVTAPVLNIGSVAVSGGNVTISGSGGTPSTGFTVITNANLTVPVASWGAATTGTFDGSGNFSISLPVSASNPRLFYIIRTP
jgi:hypothetical protein